MYDIGRILLQFPAAFLLGMFLTLLVFVEVGRRLPHRAQGGDTPPGIALMDSSVFALLGLLVAFSFSGAASRFEERRQLIVAEANAIGTVRLQLDLLSPADRTALQRLLRAYIENRIENYEDITDRAAFIADAEKGAVLQAQIWQRAIKAVASPDAQPGAAIILLPSLNTMFDISTSRTQVLRARNPPLIYAMLYGAACISALLAGTMLGHGRRDGIVHVSGFAAVIALSLYIIVDFDRPRLGLIRVDAFDTVIAQQK